MFKEDKPLTHSLTQSLNFEVVFEVVGEDLRTEVADVLLQAVLLAAVDRRSGQTIKVKKKMKAPLGMLFKGMLLLLLLLLVVVLLLLVLLLLL